MNLSSGQSTLRSFGAGLSSGSSAAAGLEPLLLMVFPSLLDWLRRAVGLDSSRVSSSRRAKSARHRARPLQITRLEERRVLNAAPTAVLSGEGVLTVSTNVSDGSASAVHMKTVQENGHSILDVNVNGQSAYRGDQSQVQAIHIAGSSGSDTLIIDFSSGNPIPRGGLVFNGQGQPGEASDSLRLMGGTFSGVNFAITTPGSGTLQLAAGSQTSVVTLQNVEQVNDSLNVSARTFQFSDAPDAVTLKSANEVGKSQLDVAGQLQVVFQNPTGSLKLDTDQGANDADRVTVDGLGSSFDASLRVAGDNADEVSFSGQSNLDQGNLNVDAGRVTVSGMVAASSGDIAIHATRQLEVGASGLLQTQTGNLQLASPDLKMAGRVVATEGGSIELNAGPQGTLLVSGSLDVSSTKPGISGGTVQLLGHQIGLLTGASVDASGQNGGGTILVGGDAHGANPLVANAAGTFVGTGVTLRADAQSIGNGGKIIVWSDRSTIFLGSISARGGAAGGNGGFAEVSGGRLSAKGTYDLSAAAGLTGTLLFDPLDIQIVGGTNDGSDNTNAANNQLINDASSNTLGSILFADEGAGSPNPFIVYESELESTDANIILEARRNITTSGTFTGADVALMNNRSLTLRTRNAAGDGAGGIDLTGSTDGTNLQFRTQGTGSITIDACTDGGAAGNINLGRLQTDGQAIGVSTKNGTITLNANVNAGAGSLTMTSTGAISQVGAEIVANSVTAKTLNDAGAGIMLASGTNNVASIDLRSRNAADTANAAGSINYRDSDSVSVTSIQTTGSAGIAAGGAVTQTGDIAANSLSVLTLNNSGAAITLTNSGNAVSSIDLKARNAANSADAAGAISYRDTDGVIVTAIQTTSTATVTSGGAVTQTGAILANTLTVKTLNDGGAAITLDNASNTVNSIDLRTRNAADSANAAGAISYRDSDDVQLSAIRTSSSATVVAGGAVTQLNPIQADVLSVKTLSNAGGSITLTSTGNAVASIDLRARNAADTANVAGSISYRDTDAVSVTAIQTTSSASVMVGGAITQTGAILANALTARTLANAGAAITLTNTGNAVTSVDLRARNAADSANAAGAISYRDTDGVSVSAIQTTSTASLVAGGAIAQTGAIVASSLTAKTLNDAGTAITLANASNAVTSIDLRSRNAADTTNAAGAISYRDTDGLSVTAIQTTSSANLVAGGALTQTGAIVADSLAAKTLNNAGAAITLTNTGNSVASVDLRARNAADTANAAGAVSYRDTDGVSVTAIQTTSSASVVAGDAITQTGAVLADALTVKTLNNTGAAITLTNAGNAVTSVDLRARNAADSENVAGAVSYRDSDGLSIAAIQTTSSASVVAGGAITQAGAMIADSLAAKTLDNAGAAITLTNAGNTVASIDLSARNAADSANVAGAISYRDSDGVSLTAIQTTSSASVVAGGAITQTGAIAADALVAKTLDNAGAGITLTNTGNAVTSIDLRARNATDTANVAGTISYRDSDGFDVAKISTTANATLQSGAAVTQSGSVEAAGLELLGAGSYTLTSTSNAITTLAGNVTGDVSYRDSDAVDVGSVNTVGLNAANVTITAGGAIGQSQAIQTAALVAKTLNDAGANITLTNAANAVTSIDLRTRNAADSANAAGTISFRDVDGFDVAKLSTTANATLQSGAAVTQSGSIQAAGLELLGAGPYTLSNAANDIDTLAGNVTNSVTFRDVDGLAIGTVTTVGLTASNVSLTVGGPFTQSQAIITGNLAIKTLDNAGAAITLNNAANNVDSIDLQARNAADTANAAGGISFRDANGFDVVKVSTTAGATLTAGDAITQSGSIESGALVAKTLNNTGAAITLANAANAVSSIDLQTRNAADSANVAGTISFRDSDGFDVVEVSTTDNATLQSGAAVTQSGTIEATGLELLGAGSFTLTNAGNAITTLAGNVTGDVLYRDSNAVDVGTVNAVGLTAANVNIVAGDAITQSQVIQTNSLTAKTLNNAGANITLDNAANTVSSINLSSRNAADAANAAGVISFRDVDGFVVAAVATTTNATLQSGAAVTQTGSIAAAGLELLGTGPYTLTNIGNAITTLAGSVTGDVVYRDTNALAVGTVNTVGLTAANVSLTGGGPITQSQAIVTNSLTAKTLNNAASNITLTNPTNAVSSIDLETRNAADTANVAGSISYLDSDGFAVAKVSTTANTTLQSGATVTQSGSIESSGLELLGAGHYLLNNTNNAVSTLAANVTGAVQYFDSNNLTVGTVNTVGITAASAEIVTLSGDLTVNQPIATSGAAGVALRSNNVNLNAPISTTGGGGVTITNAGLLNIAAAGDMNLDGAFLQNGMGSTQTAGDITTTGDNIEFQQGVTLTASIPLNTGAGAGQIIFGKTLDATAPGAESLNLTAGAGNITFAGAVGDIARLGAVNIANAGNVTVATSLKATTLNQATGSGTTSLNGPVDVTSAPGLNLTNANIAVNAAITSNGQNVNLTGLQNVTFGPAASITSGGAPVVIIADGAAGNNGGTLAMANGSSINAGGATIDLTSDGLMSLGKVTTAGGEVHLTSNSSGIVDNNTNGDDVTAASLAIRTAAGIQNGGTLGTAVSTLAAQNTTAGGLQISNSLVAGLTIGSVNGLSGISNFGPAGAVVVTSAGPLLVQGEVVNAAGGDIALRTTAGDLTTNARVMATGGSGNLTLDAAQNLLLNDTGFTADIQTTGNGVINGLSGQATVFAPNVTVQSGFGQITDIPPKLTDVFGPQITSDGLAQLFGQRGRTSELDFTVVVDWSDGTIDVVGYTPPGQIALQHFYDANPNQQDASAPIPVSLTLFGARNINFPGQNSVTANLLLTIPGDGLGRARIDIAPKVPVLTFPAAVRVESAAQTTTPLTLTTQTFDDQRNVVERNKDVLRQVFLEILPQRHQNGPDAQVQRVQLPENVLDDLSTLFKRLPDGRYRLILLEAGETQGRVLLEFNLRQHKIADTFEEEQRETPTEAEPVSPQSRLDSVPEWPIDHQLDANIEAMPQTQSIAALPENDDAGGATNRENHWPRLIGGTVVSAGLFLPRVRQNWAERVDAAFEQDASRKRGLAARLFGRFTSVLRTAGQVESGKQS